MTLGERYPGVNLHKAWPLAVSLAAHVVLVLAWLHAPVRERGSDDPQRALTVVLLPAPAPAPPPVIEPLPQAPTRANRARKPAEALAARPAAPSRPAEPSAVVALPAPAPVTPSAWDILNAAKQDIRKGGGAGRPGKAGVLGQGEGKWSRFEDGVAGAHVDHSPGPVTESYTASDGLSYYRTRVGGKVVCRKTGSTGPPAPWRSEEAIRAGAGSMATLGVGNSAGTTLCPGGKRDWVRN